MNRPPQFVFFYLCFLSIASLCSAQSADEVIEKHLKAVGGREALSSLHSRTATGTVTIATPGGEITGTIEIFAKAPNKTRTLMKLDLSSVGSREMIFDQRFDGTAGFILDTMNGNREITGNQLENMRNNIFPTAMLNYRERGITVELAGREKIGDREALVLLVRPKSGSAARHLFDPESFLILRTAVKVDVPQMGQIEQTSEFSDYREVDGVKVAFGLKVVNPAQTLVVKLMKVEHQTSPEDSMFSKPQ